MNSIKTDTVTVCRDCGMFVGNDLWCPECYSRRFAVMSIETARVVLFREGVDYIDQVAELLDSQRRMTP